VSLIGETCLDSESPSKFSFLRLVGCSYFRQHTSGFKLQTHEALYYSISDATSCYDHHDKWLAKIRTIVKQRVERRKQVNAKYRCSTSTLEEVHLGFGNVALCDAKQNRTTRYVVYSSMCFRDD